MGRISASGAQDLYNAYASVYASKEEDFSEIESLCEEWLQEKIDEGFDFSQHTDEELAEAIRGGLMDKAKQDGAERGAANAAAFKSFADRGGILGFLQRGLAGARAAVQQRGGPRGQGNRPVPGKSPLAADVAASRRQAASLGDAPARETGVPRGQMPPGAIRTLPDAKPAPAAAKPAPAAAKPAPAAAKPAPAAAKPEPASTSVAGTFKPVPGAPTQASLATARPAPEKANILGNKPSDLAAAQAKAKADSLAQAAKNRARGQRPMSARERMLNQDLDLFDIVKGHLLDEGYAETEEAALAIMSNMSEEWRNEIIESSCGGGHSKKKKKKSGY